MAKKNIHNNLLRKATHDEMSLCLAVDQRYRKLCRTHAAVRGESLAPPASLDKEMLAWRTFFVRISDGDLRVSEDEIRCLRAVAQWTVDLNCELRGQPKVLVDWGD